MKFETMIHIDKPNINISKPEVLPGNKMAAAAIFAKSSKRYNSASYQPILMKFEKLQWYGVRSVQKHQIIIEKNGKAV